MPAANITNLLDEPIHFLFKCPGSFECRNNVQPGETASVGLPSWWMDFEVRSTRTQGDWDDLRVYDTEFKFGDELERIATLAGACALGTAAVLSTPIAMAVTTGPVIPVILMAGAVKAGERHATWGRELKEFKLCGGNLFTGMWWDTNNLEVRKAADNTVGLWNRDRNDKISA